MENQKAYHTTQITSASPQIYHSEPSTTTTIPQLLQPTSTYSSTQFYLLEGSAMEKCFMADPR
ncbi:hypothetical protein CVS40_0693 [Lucilia cuprina]|nr:hypothetical protein CVS40_0693 [Lucilia cuprina]